MQFGIMTKEELYFRFDINWVDRNEFPADREKKQVPKT
jgi:hypothetical protein